MAFDTDRQLQKYEKRDKRRRAWRKGVAVLCCAAAACTAYGLIRPAAAEGRAAYCGIEEHVHTVEDCYARRLICGLEEGGLPAAETERVLACGMTEGEGAHTHTDACYETERVLTCGLEESAGHVHGESCYDENGDLICGMAEGEGGHAHADGCYAAETVLTCGLEENPGHIHTDDCYTEQPASGDGDGAGHVHTDECYEYELVCTQEEHTHTLACFSNPDADVETAEDWERTLSGVELTGSWPEDVLAVAESQLGYTESEDNYIVRDDGETVKGYTRYGAWYGDAYGDWCAMFASFCLHYAGISEEDMPYAASCPRWAEELAEPEWGLYRDAAAYMPAAGDIVFFDGDGDGYADHVGIVADRSGETLTAIEGNSANQVRKVEYHAGDDSILGFGALPENPEAEAEDPAEALTGEEQAGAEAVIAQIGALPAPEEIQEALAGYEGAGDDAGYDAYLDEISVRVSDAYAAYAALTEAEQAAVTNADKLLALAQYFGIDRNGIMTLSGDDAPDFGGYVQALSVTVVDGSAPWDSEEGDGNDTGGSNRIVRTFDSIKYNITATLASRDLNSTAKSAVVCFEMSMDKGLTEARFDTSTMTWLQTGGADWKLEYLAVDESGNEKVVLIQDAAGNYYFANDDGSQGEKTAINALVGGSESAAPYEMLTNTVARQRLSGTMTLNNEVNVFAGTQDFTAGIFVENADNGSTVSPSFHIYYQENPKNYGTINREDNSTVPVTDNNITLDGSYQDGAYAVAVTCAPLYNIILEDTSEYVNYLSWFDFSLGDEVTDANVLAYLQAAGALEENRDKVDPSEYTYAQSSDAAALYGALTAEQKANLANIRYGRMNALGITMGLSASAAEGKGYKGCSLPVGEITFDLQMGVTATATEGTPDTGGYTAILWDYRTNAKTYTYDYEDEGHIRTANELAKGNIGRNLRWNGVDFSVDGTRVAPSAYRGGTSKESSAAYDSGYWTLTAVDGSAAASSGASNVNSVYTFTVKEYDFDLDGYLFPDRYMGQSSATGTNGLGVTDFAFFGGYAEVLYVIPYAVSGTVTVNKNVTAGNLELTDLSGQTLTLAGGASRGKTVSPGNEVDAEDNHVTGAVTLYASGNFTKRNSFNTTDAINHTAGDSGQSFLGTNFWGDPNWDENSFAGEDIAIIGSVQLTANSDNNVRAVNLLQLFDSRALSITPENGITGLETAASCLTQDTVDFRNFYENTMAGHNPDVTYLFVADPAYPEGYDTNTDGVVPHMNTVREEDVLYSDKLYWNEAEGCYNLIKIGDNTYTCVGVLAEVRNCNFKDYVYIRIPVTVADDESCVGTTVCTVNAARAWIRAGAMTDISWKNGVWSDGKNTLAGYVPVASASVSAGTGYECYNGRDSFSKAEYDAGGRVYGLTGGVREGNTLLILGYKATVQITNLKEDVTKLDHYSMDSNEKTVTWIVRDITTDMGDVRSGNQQSVTSLTLPVAFAYAGTGSGSQQELFSIAGGSYTVTVDTYQTDASGALVLGSDGQPIKTGEMTYTISDDSENPAEVTFLGAMTTEAHEERPCLYTYSVYAALNADGTGVTFCFDNVPVGQALPEIRFDMYLGNSLEDNDSIVATASIGGSGDKRAYSETNGNQSTDTVYISKIHGSFLSKKVDKAYGEVGTDITYTVTYTNSSDSVMALSYLYDVLPFNGDGRGSGYSGTISLKNISFASRKTGTQEDAGDFQATVTVYCSRTADAEIQSLLAGFNGTSSTTGSANKEAVEAMLDTGDFIKLGTFDKGTWTEEPVLPESAGAVFAKIENMGPNRDIVMNLTISTGENAGGDIYGNDAWHWDPNSTALPLRSNIVQTRIFARAISGAVWYDENLNGVRDEGENTLEGVACTLFKWDADNNKYVKCAEDVTGAEIQTVVTGEDGAYAFTRLAEGGYLVAFSGDALESYGGATTYQVKGRNDDNTNDGVALITTSSCNLDEEILSLPGIAGGDFQYAVAYTLDESANVGSIPLHSLEEIVREHIPLTNSVELYVNQDLGLVKSAGYELPETGGSGAGAYIAAGLPLCLLAGAALLIRRKRRPADN